tara:strand:+ start:237 stop:914 length:678 start_codon:yes stop_codon:yes gene_type:complete
MNLGDRVKETTTTTGTGALSLAGAVSGFVSFSSVLTDGQITFYCIENGAGFEVGQGTYSTAGDTLARDDVFASTNGGALVDWSGGTKRVFITIPAVFADRSMPLIYTAAGAISRGQLVALNSDGEVSPASRSDDLGIIGVARADTSAGAAVLVDAAPGNIYTCKIDLAPASSDVGKQVYLTTSAGELTISAPTTTGRVFAAGILATSGALLVNVLYLPRPIASIA